MADELPSNPEEYHKIEKIKEKEKKELTNNQSMLINSDFEGKKEYDNASKDIKKKFPFEIVEKNIRPEGIKKMKLNPTSSLDESHAIYKSLIEDKIEVEDPTMKESIVKAAIVGHEQMKDRFTLTITINNDGGDAFEIVYFGVMAEHTEPVNTFFYPGQPIQDPDYDLKVLMERLHDELKKRGSALNHDPKITPYPQKKDWNITGVDTHLDFA